MDVPTSEEAEDFLNQISDFKLSGSNFQRAHVALDATSKAWGLHSFNVNFVLILGKQDDNLIIARNNFQLGQSCYM